MSVFREIERIKAEIVETERLLEMVLGHPIMAEGLAEKLGILKDRLNSFPQNVVDPKVQLLFSGGAVSGSQGIKSSFLSKTLRPFQSMVKTQAALERFGHVGKRGRTKAAPNTDLYLTALPTGSFGVELSQLETVELYDAEEISNAMKNVMLLIQSSSIDDETFEEAIANTPKRNLGNLKRLLKVIAEEKSILKMECGELGIDISQESVIQAYNRVLETIDEESEKVISGIFRGILLDSGKFEIQDETGQKISGFISQDLSEETLISYDKEFLNRECRIHLQVHRTKFKTGTEKLDYELLEINELS